MSKIETKQITLVSENGLVEKSITLGNDGILNIMQLDSYSLVSNTTFSITTAVLGTWYLATGWTITVPAGTYRVDLHTIVDGNITSTGIAIPVVQLGTSSTAGTNLIGFASIGNVLNFSINPSAWGNVFASQIFTFAVETTIHVNYQMLPISGTPTIEALRLRNSFPENNGLLRATRIS